MSRPFGSSFLKFGAPVVLLCVGGAFGLQQAGTMTVARHPHRELTDFVCFILQFIQGKLDLQASRGKSMLEKEHQLEQEYVARWCIVYRCG